jgi:beta-fructofuranosidase
MLLCISHNLGCRYYLGEWKDETFTPRAHGRMNWHGIDFFAPESLLTADGRRVMWAWCAVDGPPTGIQSLPRELLHPGDRILRIAPLRELEMLRADEKRATEIAVVAGAPRLLDGVSGDALELSITIHRGSARRVGLLVHSDAAGEGGLAITVDAEAGTLSIGEVEAPFDCGSEVTLRVFLDTSLVEVFADDRQAMVYSHAHRPGDDRVFLVADDAVTADVTSWRMNSMYENDRA